MAQAAEVSIATMSKAVRRASAAGLVASRRGSAVVLRDDSAARWPPPPEPAKPAPYISRIARALCDDVASGFFAPGTAVPSYKVLRDRYGAGYTVLRRALGDAEARHLIDRRGRSFHVPRVAARPQGTTIVMIAVTHDMAVLQKFTPRSTEFWYLLEHECIRLNIKLETCSYNEAIGEGPVPAHRAHRTLQDMERRGDVTGYLVWNVPETDNELSVLLTRLSAIHKPVAVFDETGSVTESSFPRPGRDVRYFAVGPGVIPGRRVGEHLLRLGHQVVACFESRPDDSIWRDRECGVRQVYAEAGRPDAVRVFRCSRTAPLVVGPPSFRRHPKEHRLFVDAFQRLMMAMTRDKSHHVEEHVTTVAETAATREIEDYLVAHAHQAPFREALTDQRVTAWVLINDAVAAIARDWLERNGVDVPGRISLVGFDASAESLALGNTTYNFNIPAVLHDILDHLLRFRPSRRIHRDASELGYVLPRGSSGPAPRPLLSDPTLPRAARA